MEDTANLCWSNVIYYNDGIVHEVASRLCYANGINRDNYNRLYLTETLDNSLSIFQINSNGSLKQLNKVTFFSIIEYGVFQGIF